MNYYYYSRNYKPHFKIDIAPIPGQKFSTCRSCNCKIREGCYRINISYPTKIIKYKERVGSPSFFLHLDCFADSPVDYIKTGKHSWRKWELCERYQEFDKESCLERFNEEERKEIEDHLVVL
jgi:hypothetical protein